MRALYGLCTYCRLGFEGVVPRTEACNFESFINII